MKIIKITIFSLLIIIMLSQNIFALDKIFAQSEDWTDTGNKYTGYTMDTTNLRNISDVLYNILLAVATVVAIVVGAMLGLKYMTAGIDKKVEVKESLFPYLISCMVVFGAFGIWKLVVIIMSGI